MPSSKSKRMSAPQGGLILCQQTRPNATEAYYLKKGEPIDPAILVSPVGIQSADGVSTPSLIARGLVGGVPTPYTGGITIEPASSSLGPAPAGLNIHAGVAGVAVEVGTNGAGIVNTLEIAGASGLSQVNDPVYNPAVALKAITMVSTNPLSAPTVGNTGEIFRCAQAGVVASATSAVGNTFTVPADGWYSLQMEVKLENDVAPAVPSINVPITPAGSIDIGETLTFTITQGVVVEPYGAMECVSQEFAVSSILQQGGNVIRQYVSQHLFQAGVNYVFALRSSSALWNIGANGQIKAELIAMC